MDSKAGQFLTAQHILDILIPSVSNLTTLHTFQKGRPETEYALAELTEPPSTGHMSSCLRDSSQHHDIPSESIHNLTIQKPEPELNTLNIQ